MEIVKDLYVQIFDVDYDLIVFVNIRNMDVGCVVMYVGEQNSLISIEVDLVNFDDKSVILLGEVDCKKNEENYLYDIEDLG